MFDRTSIKAVLGVLAVIGVLGMAAFLIADFLLVGSIVADGWDGLVAPGTPTLASGEPDRDQKRTDVTAENDEGDDTGSEDTSPTDTPYLAFTDDPRGAGSRSTTSQGEPGSSGQGTSGTGQNPGGSQNPDDPENPGDPGDSGSPDDPQDPFPDDPKPDPGDPKPDPGDPPAATPAAWLWGYVDANGADGSLAGLRVRIQGTNASATTDASGRYVITDVQPGSTVRARLDLGGTDWRACGPASVEVGISLLGGTRHDFAIEPRKAPKEGGGKPIK